MFNAAGLPFQEFALRLAISSGLQRDVGVTLQKLRFSAVHVLARHFEGNQKACVLRVRFRRLAMKLRLHGLHHHSLFKFALYPVQAFDPLEESSI
jgi:hypothetical protein